MHVVGKMYNIYFREWTTFIFIMLNAILSLFDPQIDASMKYKMRDSSVLKWRNKKNLFPFLGRWQRLKNVKQSSYLLVAKFSISHLVFQFFQFSHITKRYIANVINRIMLCIEEKREKKNFVLCCRMSCDCLSLLSTQ
jgi:hypothetical protein